jgi:hypothetical protein
MPVILATQEAQIRRIKAGSQPRANRPYFKKKNSFKIKGWWSGSRCRP